MSLIADVMPKEESKTKIEKPARHSTRLAKPRSSLSTPNEQRTPDPWLPPRGINLPDHTQLPEEDGTFVKNFLEHPQSIMLTSSLEPLLKQLHPDGQYAIGQDSGIYWDWTDPPQDGAEAPDWFYVPNRPPTLNGEYRRSYVMWKEITPPLLAIEFVSGNGSEERDPTPYTGKYWVYEQAVRIPYYAIYNVKGNGSIELYVLQKGRYELVAANARKHYPIPPLGIELGLWQGTYKNVECPWLRVWDANGNLLLEGDERAEEERQIAAQERQRAAQERQIAAQERQRAEQERQAKESAMAELEDYKAQLRALGIIPKKS